LRAPKIQIRQSLFHSGWNFCVRPAWAWTCGVKVHCIWTPFHHFMMVAKVLAEGKRLRLAMASQEGIIARWCPCLPCGM